MSMSVRVEPTVAHLRLNKLLPPNRLRMARLEVGERACSAKWPHCVVGLRLRDSNSFGTHKLFGKDVCADLRKFFESSAESHGITRVPCRSIQILRYVICD